MKTNYQFPISRELLSIDMMEEIFEELCTEYFLKTMEMEIDGSSITLTQIKQLSKYLGNKINK